MKYFKALLLVLPFFFAGCGDDEPEAETGGYKIVAHSDGVTVSGTGATITADPMGGSYSLEIVSDGVVSFTEPDVDWISLATYDNSGDVEIYVNQGNSEARNCKLGFTVILDNEIKGGIITISQPAVTYEDMTKRENEAIAYYLKNEGFPVKELPVNDAFIAGDDAPFYKLPDGAYMRIQHLGEKGKASDGDRVYFRFDRFNLLDYYNSIPHLSVGIPADTYSFILNDFSVTSSKQWGQGLQLPIINGLPIGSHIYLVLPSAIGLESEISQVVPFCYDLIYVDSEKVDNRYLVNIPFKSVAEWDMFGVSGALQYRVFDKEKNLPAGFPYSEIMATGLGGVLLYSDASGNPHAFDLACPVENSKDYAVHVEDNGVTIKCDNCGSEFSLIQNGIPLQGPAAEKLLTLRRYNVYILNGNWVITN